MRYSMKEINRYFVSKVAVIQRSLLIHIDVLASYERVARRVAEGLA